MSEPRVTVGIPIGPGYKHEWLIRAIESVNQQSVHCHIVVVDDMATSSTYQGWALGKSMESTYLHWWDAPWNLGVANAFNHCVALAPTELVFMMGHDDWLEPDCIEECLKAYDATRDAEHGYYYVRIKYTDTGEEQMLANNCAMVHKQLWRETGGFPLESTVGAPDSMFVSRMMRRDVTGFPGHMVAVDPGHHLYNYNRHPATISSTRSVAWQPVIFAVRDILATDFTKPNWGRTC